MPHFLRADPSVRSERSRESGGVEECVVGGFAGLRLRSATLRPNGKGLTVSEEVYESSVVRFRQTLAAPKDFVGWIARSHYPCTCSAPDNGPLLDGASFTTCRFTLNDRRQ